MMKEAIRVCRWEVTVAGWSQIIRRLCLVYQALGGNESWLLQMARGRIREVIPFFDDNPDVV